MRVILTCAPENIEKAYNLLRKEMQDEWQRRYDKPGWGWFFYEGEVRFFVRGIVGGLSISQVK
jgi:hypothetical protein